MMLFSEDASNRQAMRDAADVLPDKTPIRPRDMAARIAISEAELLAVTGLPDIGCMRRLSAEPILAFEPDRRRLAAARRPYG